MSRHLKNWHTRPHKTLKNLLFFVLLQEHLMALSEKTIQNLSIALTPDVIDDIFQDERYIELMMELIPEFVMKNLQSEDYDLVTEIAVSIMDNIAMKPRRTVWQLAPEAPRRP